MAPFDRVMSLRHDDNLRHASRPPVTCWSTICKFVCRVEGCTGAMDATIVGGWSANRKTNGRWRQIALALVSRVAGMIEEFRTNYHNIGQPHRSLLCSQPIAVRLQDARSIVAVRHRSSPPPGAVNEPSQFATCGDESLTNRDSTLCPRRFATTLRLLLSGRAGLLAPDRD